MSYTWTTPIRYVRGLGPQRAKEMTKIGIHTVGDLLERTPNSYIYPGITNIVDAKEGMVVIKAKIEGIRHAGFRTPSVVADLDDETGTCQAVWYGKPYLLQHLYPGMVVTFYGKFKGGFQQPKWTTVESSLADVYGGQYGVHHATIRAALKEVLANVELPAIQVGKVEHTRADVFESFHFPQDKTEQRSAFNALKFDECLMLQLALAERKKKQQQIKVKPMIWDRNGDRAIVSHFQYEFTDDQDNAIDDVIHDMCDKHTPMQRLIHGEVGSGKTAVAFYAAMLAALNGKRTLILAPTTILAQQHFDNLRGMGWDDVGLCIGPDKNHRWGFSGNIIIGTHSLLNWTDITKCASLVIIDEFQKFGVEQRAKIQQNHPHLLLLSATPLPRSLNMTVFGDLDISVIRELPIKRGTVITRWVLS